jgi:hypothetical protein
VSSDGETQEFARADFVIPPEVLSVYHAAVSPGPAAIRRRLASPALGATPRKVHALPDALVRALVTVVLVLAGIALLGLIALEIELQMRTGAG